MENLNLPLSSRELEHKLRAALTVILGNTDFLDDEDLTLRQRGYIEDIRQSGKNLLGLVNYLSKQIRPNNPIVFCSVRTLSRHPKT